MAHEDDEYDDDEYIRVTTEEFPSALSSLWAATGKQESTFVSDVAQALQNQAENIGIDWSALKTALID